MKILSIIPARSGSKSIPHKNIKLLQGKPLLAYSIEQALSSELINRVIVSTDSEEYAQIAKEFGAEVPFIRPLEYAQDESPDLFVFKHALQWLSENEQYNPDFIVHLRPTYPIRKINDINNCIRIMINNLDYDSIRSVVLAPETPYKMWHRGEDGIIQPVLGNAMITEAHSLPRQSLPRVYLQNACIDVIRTSTIIEKNSMVGQNVYGYLMDQNFDIDYYADFNKVSEILIKGSILSGSSKTFCFDIDGVIASIVNDNDYSKATPIEDTIKLIQKLYQTGHTIILNTARGFVTGIDWKELTIRQLYEWNVPYHQLFIGIKPAADFYIDDKLIDLVLLKRFFNI